VSRKKKFDLSHLVHQGVLKDGETLFYVVDPKKTCQIAKQPNGDFKVIALGEVMTVHSFAQKCLEQEPQDHAAKWLRNSAGKTLFELWHAEDMEEAA